MNIYTKYRGPMVWARLGQMSVVLGQGPNVINKPVVCWLVLG